MKCFFSILSATWSVEQRFWLFLKVDVRCSGALRCTAASLFFVWQRVFIKEVTAKTCWWLQRVHLYPAASNHISVLHSWDLSGMEANFHACRVPMFPCSLFLFTEWQSWRTISNQINLHLSRLLKLRIKRRDGDSGERWFWRKMVVEFLLSFYLWFGQFSVLWLTFQTKELLWQPANQTFLGHL